MPVSVEPENVEPPAFQEAWQQDVLHTLQAILATLRGVQEVLYRAVLAERSEPPVVKEPAAASMEPSGSNEPLGTWILEDARVEIGRAHV